MATKKQQVEKVPPGKYGDLKGRRGLWHLQNPTRGREVKATFVTKYQWQGRSYALFEVWKSN